MGKQNLPSVDLGIGEMPDSMKKAINEAAKVAAVLLKDDPHLQQEGYAARMVDVRMTGEQPNKFKKIARHLEDIGAQLADGSPVNNNRRVALWLIENFDIPNR